MKAFLIGHRTDDSRMRWVDSDHDVAAYGLTRRLIEQGRKRFVYLGFAVILGGCASAQKKPTQAAIPQPPMSAEKLSPSTERDFEQFDAEFQKKTTKVSDPLSGYNRGMFWVNDKLYFYFFKPLAKALVEQRHILAFDADARLRVLRAIDALTIAPERFTPEAGIYLGLRAIYWQLDHARNAAARQSAEEQFDPMGNAARVMALYDQLLSGRLALE